MTALQRNPQLSVLLVLLLLFSGACAKKVPLTTPQTLQLSTAQAIATLSSLNKGIASSVIQLNAARVVPDLITREVLAYNEKVANSVKASVIILGSTGTPAEKSAQILATLDQIRVLPTALQNFVSSPDVQQSAVALVSMINSIVQLVAGLVKTPAPVPAPTGGRV